MTNTYDEYATCYPEDSRGEMLGELRCIDDRHDKAVKHRAKLRGEPCELEVTW